MNRREIADLLVDPAGPRPGHRPVPGPRGSGGTTGRQHLLHRLAAEDLRAGERLVGGDRQLSGPVGGADPGPAHRQPASADGDRPGLAAVPNGGPVPVVPTLGTAQRVHVGGHHRRHHRRHHLQARAHGQRQQALADLGGDLAHRHAHHPRHAHRPGRSLGGARGGGLLLVVLGHGGPLSHGVLGGSPETCRRPEVAAGAGKRRFTRTGIL